MPSQLQSKPTEVLNGRFSCDERAHLLLLRLQFCVSLSFSQGLADRGGWLSTRCLKKIHNTEDIGNVELATGRIN